MFIYFLEPGITGSLAIAFLTIPISVRRLFGAWEAVWKGPIDIG